MNTTRSNVVCKKSKNDTFHCSIWHVFLCMEHLQIPSELNLRDHMAISNFAVDGAARAAGNEPGRARGRTRRGR
jgi:hypothetical protein